MPTTKSIEQPHTNPPDVPGVVPDHIETSYNIDRQVTNVDRPDGKAITPTYDSVGWLASLAFFRGSVGLTYSATPACSPRQEHSHSAVIQQTGY